MYFGESRHPGLRRPDPEKDRLAEQNALLKKLLLQQTENTKQQRSRRKHVSMPFRKRTPSSGPQTTAVSRQPQKAKISVPKHKQLVLWIGTAFILVLLVGGGLVLFMNRSTGVLPADFTKDAGFTLYYPSPMIPGYSLKKGSAKLNGGSAFYTLQNGSNIITISEQAVPVSLPDLSKLAGFTSLKTIAGNAAVGTSAKKPIVIIASNTTLISITGQQSMPQDIVAEVAQNMRSL